MKIAIHYTSGLFSDYWISYCQTYGIIYKKVDCYRHDILLQLSDCEALMWHFSQNSPKAVLFAKQLLYSVQLSGRKVFPDFYTSWHFDDKIGQKYLFDAINAPRVPTWIFYDKNEALEWAKTVDFPKVFKLRCGAGSQNVRLVKNRNSAYKLIRKAFTSGFNAYDPMGSLKERWRLNRLGKTNSRDLLEGMVRFILPPPYSIVRGKEKGYIYFQEFIPGNDYDIRVIVIGDKAFAIKRMVRENDFRASGSGEIYYERSLFNESTIRLSFDLAASLKSQCIALDYVHQNGNPLVVEISYGFSPEGYTPCPGYWDKDLIWHEGPFNPYGWMIQNIMKDKA